MRSLGFGIALLASTTAAASQQAHVHGEGNVNIAIEDDRVYLELESPGADIVGFEYAARTDDEIAAVTAAVARLRDPMQIMRFDAAANCRVVSAATGMELEEGDHDEHGDHKHEEHEEHDEHKSHKHGEDDEHDEHDSHKHEDHDEHDEHDHDESADGHSAFTAEYEIQCADMNALTAIEFTYFKHFPNAQSLSIVLIQGNGQRQQDVDRSNPVLSLGQ